MVLKLKTLVYEQPLSMHYAMTKTASTAVVLGVGVGEGEGGGMSMTIQRFGF